MQKKYCWIYLATLEGHSGRKAEIMHSAKIKFGFKKLVDDDRWLRDFPIRYIIQGTPNQIFPNVHQK